MQKLSPLDQLDPNNVGGREQMINRMYSHQTALLKIKPTLDTQKPPKPHVDANKKDKPPLKYKKLLEYGNVYKTFSAVVGASKPIIDSKEPETTKFKSFWGKKNKAQKFQEKEHELNLRAQQKRIQGIGSMVERKKNPHDPLAHPTYLLSSDPQPKTNNYLLKQILKPQKTANQIDLSRLYPKKDKKERLEAEGGQNQLDQRSNLRPQSAKPVERSNSYMKKTDGKNEPPKPVIDKSKRPQTAKTITKEQYEQYKKEVQMKQNGVIEVDFVDEIPKAKGVKESDYTYIKEALIQLLIKYRIYQERDMKILFGRTVVYNQHMKMDKLDQIFDEIKSELDK
ncbi:hypothetical protein ABPG72_006859 [Tetrahymena utriculariae]